MTVSLALRNSREVSAATRRRIQRLARLAGYRPDPHIAKLMHHLRTRRPARFKATLCGLGHRFPHDQIARGNYGDQLHEGLRIRAESLGFGYDRLFIEDYLTGAQLERVLLNRGIEGLVILPLLRATDLSDLLDWSRFAVVAATPAVLAPRFHSVMPNHFDNMLILCVALRRSGYRKIGLAIPEDWNRRVKFRWAGGIAWQNLFGGTTPVNPLFTKAPGPSLDPEEFGEWLLRERPDAVITDAAHHSALAPGLARLPARHRPKLVTMNWPDPSAVAGIDQRSRHIGAVTIELLASMLTRGERGAPAVPSSTMVEGAWNRGSLPPGRAESAGLTRSRARAT
jgi:DNA-binding LacI/PurR family transcriptional regulator